MNEDRTFQSRRVVINQLAFIGGMLIMDAPPSFSPFIAALLRVGRAIADDSPTLIYRRYQALREEYILDDITAALPTDHAIWELLHNLKTFIEVEDLYLPYPESLRYIALCLSAIARADTPLLGDFWLGLSEGLDQLEGEGDARH